MNAFFIAPAISGVSLRHAHLDPPVARAAARAARQDRRPSSASPATAPADACDAASGTRSPGARKPKQANLDALFLVPERRDHPRDRGRAARRPASARSASGRPTGAAYQQTQDDVVALLDGRRRQPDVEVQRDDFGFTWLRRRTGAADDIEGLCTDLHAVNTALEEQGFGAGLLCSLVPFARPRRVARSGWSTSTSRAPSTRSPRPARSAATTCSRSRSATRSGRAADGGRSPALDRPVGCPRALTRRRRATPPRARFRSWGDEGSRSGGRRRHGVRAVRGRPRPRAPAYGVPDVRRLATRRGRDPGRAGQAVRRVVTAGARRAACGPTPTGR